MVSAVPVPSFQEDMTDSMVHTVECAGDAQG